MSELRTVLHAILPPSFMITLMCLSINLMASGKMGFLNSLQVNQIRKVGTLEAPVLLLAGIVFIAPANDSIDDCGWPVAAANFLSHGRFLEQLQRTDSF